MRSFTGALTAGLAVFLVAGPAHAQRLPTAPPGAAQQTQSDNGGKWQVEVHIGGLAGASPTTGTPILEFPVGESIPTPGGFSTTRAVPSWYFGDGAALLNQVNEQFNMSQRITPLDAALQRALATRDGGGSFGFRVSRNLTPRLAAEFNFDYADTPVELLDSAIEAIGDTQASFVPAWTDLLGTGFTFNQAVTSTGDIVQGDASQMVATGAIVVRLTEIGRLRPYATAGAGALLNRGTLPRADITGQYSFDFANLFPIEETDSVSIRLAMKDRVFVGVLGGGVTYDLSPNQGVRVDVRVHLSDNPIDTLVDAQPSVTQQMPAFAINTGTRPAVQFSNNDATGFRSSLSGDAVSDLATFSGSGVHRQVLFSVGYFIRF
jgi:hypothetical protein